MPKTPTTTSRSSELVSTRYKCAAHDVWLTLHTLDTPVGVFRFWQCPVLLKRGVVRTRCQTCKPCKTGERIKKKQNQKGAKTASTGGQPR